MKEWKNKRKIITRKIQNSFLDVFNFCLCSRLSKIFSHYGGRITPP